MLGALRAPGLASRVREREPAVHPGPAHRRLRLPPHPWLEFGLGGEHRDPEPRTGSTRTGRPPATCRRTAARRCSSRCTAVTW
ncbi:hypothetical protein ACFQ1I_18765 [Kitasatospora arboriphila]